VIVLLETLTDVFSRFRQAGIRRSSDIPVLWRGMRKANNRAIKTPASPRSLEVSRRRMTLRFAVDSCAQSHDEHITERSRDIAIRRSCAIPILPHLFTLRMLFTYWLPSTHGPN